MKETPEERAQRLLEAREAAAKALFDQYEKWNDRGFLKGDQPLRCSTHEEERCVICHPRKSHK